jgi:long-chain acyl-CoA synthetase
MDFFENDLQFSKIIFKDRFYYPPEINAAIHDVVAFLKGSIVSNTPFIYLFAPNHIKTIIAYFAIIKSGHVCVLVDPEIGRLELAEMKQDTPPCALIHIDRLTDAFDYKKEIVFTENNPQEYDWDELEDVAMIVYTNAEDGYAKGAMLTRRNLLANAESSMKSNNFSCSSVICQILPLHHLFGLQTGVVSPLFASSVTGASVLLLEYSSLITISKLFNSIVQYKATHLCSVPIAYYLLLRDRVIISHLQKNIKLCSGGCALSETIFNSFLNKTQITILEGYGLTEASPVCSWYQDHDAVKFGSVGKFSQWCSIKIIKDPPSHFNNNGVSGEICISGNNVMKGYYKNKTATNRVFSNGWLLSGDVGTIDNEGYLFLTGLKKNMFNINGNKVYPVEVERIIRFNPIVLNVKLYFKNHDVNNTEINAHINLKENTHDSQNQFKAWLRNSISIYKIPKFIDFS